MLPPRYASWRPVCRSGRAGHQFKRAEFCPFCAGFCPFPLSLPHRCFDMVGTELRLRDPCRSARSTLETVVAVGTVMEAVRAVGRAGPTFRMGTRTRKRGDRRRRSTRGGSRAAGGDGGELVRSPPGGHHRPGCAPRGRGGRPRLLSLRPWSDRIVVDQFCPRLFTAEPSA